MRDWLIHVITWYYQFQYMGLNRTAFKYSPGNAVEWYAESFANDFLDYRRGLEPHCRHKLVFVLLLLLLFFPYNFDIIY